MSRGSEENEQEEAAAAATARQAEEEARAEEAVQRAAERRKAMFQKLHDSAANRSLGASLAPALPLSKECEHKDPNQEQELEENTGGNDGAKKHKSSACKPPEGSTLCTLLKLVKDQVKLTSKTDWT